MEFTDFLQGIEDLKYFKEDCEDNKSFVIRRSGSEDYFVSMNEEDIQFKDKESAKIFFNVKKAEKICEEINSIDENYRVRLEEIEDMEEVSRTEIADKARRKQAIDVGKRTQEYINRTAKSDTIDRTIEYFIDAGKKSSQLIAREFIQDIVKNLDKKSLINIFNALKLLTNDKVMKELVKTSQLKVAGDDEESFEDEYLRAMEKQQVEESISEFITGLSILSE